MNEILYRLLYSMRAGTCSIREVLDHTTELNQIANIFLSRNTDLKENEILDLNALLHICNIMYNCTDLDILPIEDGIYDLLLELYKRYDKNFQVGSEMITFTDGSQFHNKVIEDKVNPLRFYTEEEWKERENGLYYNQLYQTHIWNARDLNRCPIRFEDPISKRTHNTEHNYPELVGTLDKCKFVTLEEAREHGVENDTRVKVLERDFFADHIYRGILDPNRKIRMCLELKYDGISVEADCSNVVEGARSRGDTGLGEAADITPILYGYPFVHATPYIAQPSIGIKFEAIMTNSDLLKFNEVKQYNYKNCRTAIIGLFGSSDAYLYRDYITLIPLAIAKSCLPPNTDRETEICLMNQYFSTHGEPLRYVIIEGDYKSCLFQIKRFVSEAEIARSSLNFMYDGVVVSYLDQDLIDRLGRENYINKYSMAIKFNALKRQTTFRGYTYTVGQDGSITPMIHYDQVEFFGTIHTKSTGHSYARFMSLGLKYGDIIDVEYTNDVMPYVSKIDCEQNRHNQNPVIEFPTTCPCCGSSIYVTENFKSAYCLNLECPDRVISRMANMLQKLNVKDFGRERIIDLGVTHFKDFFSLKIDEIAIIGEGNGTKLMDRIYTLSTDPIYDYQLIGAIGFTSVGSKTWQLILQEYTLEEVLSLYENNQLDSLISIKGIGEGIINTIKEEMIYFLEDMKFILSMKNVISSKGASKRKTVRFTGTRNKELSMKLESMGYDADDTAGVTKTTDILLVPYEGFSSSKTKKVGENTLIVPIQEFIEHMDLYL